MNVGNALSAETKKTAESSACFVLLDDDDEDDDDANDCSTCHVPKRPRQANDKESSILYLPRIEDMNMIKSEKVFQEQEDNDGECGDILKKPAPAARSTTANCRFWRVETDAAVFSLDRSVGCSFVVHGNPLAWQRTKRSKSGHEYNPSEMNQRVFRSVVQEIMMAADTIKGSSASRPFFRADQSLSMSLIFRMKRPLSHFVARNRGMGQLKPTAPTEMSAIRSDIDNLAKFILDCLNGVIYKDDCQIFHLVSTKLLDSEADCLGSTEVLVREVAVDELERILRK